MTLNAHIRTSHLAAHLDGTGEQVAIMRQASCERRPIVERELRAALGKFQAGSECIDTPPVVEDFFLLLGEVEGYRDFNRRSFIEA